MPADDLIDLATALLQHATATRVLLTASGGDDYVDVESCTKGRRASTARPLAPAFRI